ncbi:Holliday junction branch migration protein RuvA [Candidatus Acetothermia bacterium]|nr:Holliday junction branch migration protein RuvA [Candidatus Acetothermia bacterium]MCI2427376.1 Holliday junction branch migration protein RuvA [Candidatus Acetothermia bacterium]MCI2428713.1 Holliday junction branch migration protein RuvA [Candidatus Acetothermia bacterium]
MIDYFEGRIVRLERDRIVIEVGSVGYALLMPPTAIATLNQGEVAQIFIHLILSDNSLVLYGFLSPNERRLFQLLLGVPQVGPRIALETVSALSPAQFTDVLNKGDLGRLIEIKGIGRKIAQRILIELRDKMITDSKEIHTLLPLSVEQEQALQILTSKSLGFSVGEARRAIEQVKDKKLTLQELVRQALANMGK